METLHVSNHPLIQRDITLLRDRNCQTAGFREALERISLQLAYEGSTDLSIAKICVQTPLEETVGSTLNDIVTLVPILRAGLGMVPPFLKAFPDARVGHIGLYRNEETLEPVEYYSKYPHALAESAVFLLDPMLATGGSAVTALTVLKKQGARNIRLVCIVAAPEGVKRVGELHRDVPIYAAVYDRGLNERGYIVPGLGDAGDRLFGTE